MSATTASPPATPAAPTHRPGLAARLFEPVPIAPLVQFRVALGLILLWEAYRYLSAGWPRSLYLDPPFLFKFYGFEWVRPLPEPLHLAVFPLLGLCAACVTVGFCYRLAAAVSFVGWAYVFLLEQALYLNHLYLVTLIAGLAVALPAHRAASVDAHLRPRLRADFAPRWTLALLRAQVGLVYFFGGVAKLDADWFSGVPMQMMLVEFAAGQTPNALLDRLLGDPAVALGFAYSGMLFDLFVVPLLWWPRTRPLGLLMVAAFHLTNHTIFRIGIFPWFMLAATLILWPPYPLSLLSFGRIYGSLVAIGMVLTAFVAGREVPTWAWGAAVVAGGLLAFPPRELLRVNALLPVSPSPLPPLAPSPDPPRGVRPIVLGLLALYLGYHVLMPFRYLLYPGAVNWTEQGHKWSWHMKLRIKYPTEVAFFVVDGDGRTVGMYAPRRDENGDVRMSPLIDPVGLGRPLTARQTLSMSTRPDLILQFAHHLRDAYAGRVKGPVKVTANVQVSLNGRDPQHLIDPEADLASVEARLWPPADWILPLATDRPDLRPADIPAIRAAREPREAPGENAEEP